ncbi:MAG: hypothetical protein A2Y59_00540 [Chloroflexi bacterium RBG_13_52_14]|nr:MAG: hypothetical protein A2Y59_00540 [Chloroflexi bacterium RBG_13_52_14]
MSRFFFEVLAKVDGQEVLTHLIEVEVGDNGQSLVENSSVNLVPENVPLGESEWRLRRLE